MTKLERYSSFILLILFSQFLIAQSPGEQPSLGDVARELRNKQAQNSRSAPSPKAPNSGPKQIIVRDSPELTEFVNTTRSLLLREKFSDLDKIADDARTSRARFSGGEWKISRFYNTLNRPEGGRNAPDSDWQAIISILHRWNAARPDSIAARVSLASAYIQYAEYARGAGYANSVTQQGWSLFEEREKEAQKILLQTEPKDPHWFILLQQIALGGGASKEQQRAIFEKAIEFEPDYYIYYQQFSTTLLPRWMGEPGDVEALANEAYTKIGGKKGAHVYFEIASGLCFQCGDFTPANYSWEKLKEGFSAMEEMYGVNPQKLNRYAFLAASYGDKEVAASAFQRIGPHWDPQVWGNFGRFQSLRTWAGLSSTPPSDYTGRVWTSGPPPQETRLEALLRLAEDQRRNNHRTESTVTAWKAIKIAKPLPGAERQLCRGYLIVADNEYRVGNIAKANSALEEAVISVSAKAGRDSILLADTLELVAGHARSMREYHKSEDYLRRSIEIHKKTNGPNDRDLINIYRNLGLLYNTQGRRKEALNAYLQAVNTSEGIQHDASVISPILEEIASLYQGQGQIKEAEAAYLRALRIEESRHGLNSQFLISPLSRLAELYRQLGRLQEEQKLRDRVKAIRGSISK